jgi:hypothetical protein
MRNVPLLHGRAIAITLVSVAASAILAAGPARAAVSVDCVTAPSTALQSALAAASDGDELDISGTCVGTFSIPGGFDTLGLTLRGVSKGATLDGNGAGTTVTLPGGGKVTIEYLTITGGHGATEGAGSPGAEPTSGFGGGISSSGTVTLSHVTVTGNVGGTGGAGRADIEGGNGADGGPGAILNYGFLTVIDSTISGNTGGPGGAGGLAADQGGDGGNGGPGGLSDRVQSGDTSILSSTIGGNTGGVGGAAGPAPVPGSAGASGIGGFWMPSGNITLTASVLADNDPGGAADCAGSVSSGGYNVIGSTTGCTFSATTADQTGTSAVPLDARLSALVYHDGLTKTMGLNVGSPAVGVIPVASGACPPDDQRGVARPQGTNCDAGSLEVASTTLTIRAPKSVTAGSKARIKGALTSVTTPCLSHRTVTLIKGEKSAKTQQTTADGSYAFTLTIKKRTTVHVEFAGNSACSPSASVNRTIRIN